MLKESEIVQLEITTNDKEIKVKRSVSKIAQSEQADTQKILTAIAVKLEENG